MINWKVRFKNKTFWLAIIPAVIVLIQSIANLFGFVIDLSELGNKLKDVVESVFAVLIILGVVVDHTTKGFADSEQALTYDEPKV